MPLTDIDGIMSGLWLMSSRESTLLAVFGNEYGMMDESDTAGQPGRIQ
jgi:hypothetical protein